MDAILLNRTPTDLPCLAPRDGRGAAAASDLARRLARSEAAPNLLSCAWTREKIAWAVATPVGNAPRYVRRGTRRLLWEHPHESKPRARPRVIAVEDDGPGIPPEKVETLLAAEPG